MSEAWREFEEKRRDQARALLVLGGVAALGLLVFLHFYGDAEENPRATATMGSEAVRPDPRAVASEPKVEIDSVTEIAPPVAVDPTKGDAVGVTRVYECQVNGQRVVSDQPCGPDAQARTLAVDQPDPDEAARQQQRTWAAQQGSAPSVAGSTPMSASTGSSLATANQSACAQVDAEIAALNAQMRQGYTSPQGEQYRKRWHALQQRRAELDCGR